MTGIVAAGKLKFCSYVTKQHKLTSAMMWFVFSLMVGSSKPYHPLRLEVRQYIPVPGDESSGEFDHLAGDTNHDWNRLTGLYMN